MSAASRTLTPLARGFRLRGAGDREGLAVAGVSDAGASTSVRAARVLLTTGTGLGLVALLACSLFARYTSHAFQMADLLRRSGYIGGQIAWYTGWTGRFSSNATWLAAVAPGPVMARVLPTLYLVLWGAALWFTLPRVAALAGRGLDGVARLLAVEVILFATLTITPALWFDLYKLTGEITYLTPLVLGTAALGMALRATRDGRLSNGAALALGLLSAFAVGYSDTWAGVQPVLIVGFGVCALFLRGRRRLAALRCGLVAAAGSAIGLVVLVHAPGNAVRRSFYPPPPHLASAIGASIRDAWGFVTGPVAHSGLAVAIVAVAFLVLGASSARRGETSAGLSLRRVVVAVLAAITVVVAAHLPSEQMTSAAPPPRSEIIPTYAIVAVLALLAWWTGVSLSMRRRRVHLGLAAATAAMVVAPAMTMTLVAQNWQGMSAYAAAVDRQWQVAAAAPKHADVLVPPVSSTGIGPLSHDPMQELRPNSSYWTNQAVAEYFGLHSVRVDSGSNSR